jgi:DNA-binding MarR family transcriptional regulator
LKRDFDIFPLVTSDEVSHISRHLVSVSSAVRTRVSNGLQQRGHRPSIAVTHLVPNLPADGLGMSALAERSGLSIQRAGQLVAQLEDDGYVQRVPDERDGRARRVVYTRRGRKLLADIDELLEEVRERFDTILGKRRAEQLLRDLADLDRELNGPDRGLRIAIG